MEATKLTVAYFFELTLLNQKSLVMSRFARDKMNWINFRDCSSQYRNVCNYWLSGQLENSNVLPNPNPEVNSWIEAGLSLFVGLKTLVTLLSLILWSLRMQKHHLAVSRQQQSQLLSLTWACISSAKPTILCSWYCIYCNTMWYGDQFR